MHSCNNYYVYSAPFFLDFDGLDWVLKDLIKLWSNNELFKKMFLMKVTRCERTRRIEVCNNFWVIGLIRLNSIFFNWKFLFLLQIFFIRINFISSFAKLFSKGPKCQKAKTIALSWQTVLHFITFVWIFFLIKRVISPVIEWII